MTKKRISSILLAALLVLTLLLTGCGQSAAPKQSDAPAQTTPTTSQPKESDRDSDTTPSAPDSEGEVPKPEDYPSKNIHWIVPAPAGAALDLPTRALADILDLGKSIVVENVPGGSQTIGTAEAVSRGADGYTLLTMANACGITQPLMNPVSYEISDLRPIAMLAPVVQCVVAVRADSEIQDVDDWLELLDSSEEYYYGVTNVGGFGHMAISSTLSQLGHYDDENSVMIVYTGSAENMTALLSGEPDFIIADAPDALPRVESGEIRPIVVLHDEPCALFPDVPIIKDYGVENMSTFVGLKWVAVHSDTPEEIVAWLKQEINKEIQNEKYQEYLVQQGFGRLREYTEDELNALLDTARNDYAKVMRDTGMID
jgi:tripartite-type tricarboxylate transporter receptor subunit TctC